MQRGQRALAPARRGPARTVRQVRRRGGDARDRHRSFPRRRPRALRRASDAAGNWRRPACRGCSSLSRAGRRARHPSSCSSSASSMGARRFVFAALAGCAGALVARRAGVPLAGTAALLAGIVAVLLPLGAALGPSGPLLAADLGHARRGPAFPPRSDRCDHARPPRDPRRRLGGPRRGDARGRAAPLCMDRPMMAALHADRGGPASLAALPQGPRRRFRPY